MSFSSSSFRSVFGFGHKPKATTRPRHIVDINRFQDSIRITKPNRPVPQFDLNRYTSNTPITLEAKEGYGVVTVEPETIIKVAEIPEHDSVAKSKQYTPESHLILHYKMPDGYKFGYVKKENMGELTRKFGSSEYRFEPFEGALFETDRHGIPQISEDDIKQGSLGDCFLLATLSSIARNNPEFITRNLITDNEDGTVTVHLHKRTAPSVFEPQDIVLKKELPRKINIGRRSQNPLSDGSAWVKFVELAYASLLPGSHLKSIDNGGLMTDVFEAIFGKDTRLIPFSVFGSADALFSATPFSEVEIDFQDNQSILDILESEGILTQREDGTLKSTYEDVVMPDLFEHNLLMVLGYAKNFDLANDKTVNIGTPLIKGLFNEKQLKLLVREKKDGVMAALVEKGYLEKVTSTVNGRDYFKITPKYENRDVFNRDIVELTDPDTAHHAYTILKGGAHQPKLMIPQAALLAQSVPGLAAEDASKLGHYLQTEVKEKIETVSHISKTKVKTHVRRSQDAEMFIKDADLSVDAKEILREHSRAEHTYVAQRSGEFTRYDRYVTNVIEYIRDNLFVNRSGADKSIKSFIGAATHKLTDGDRETRVTSHRGLADNHAYEVYDIKEKDNGTVFVYCRNPWGGAQAKCKLEASVFATYFGTFYVMPYRTFGESAYGMNFSGYEQDHKVTEQVAL